MADDAATKVSLRMQDIARTVQAMIKEACGEDIAFTLMGGMHTMRKNRKELLG